MRTYVAGPMTGYEQFNFPAFDTAARRLREAGHDVFNPAENDRNLLGKPADWLPCEQDSLGPWKQWATPGAPSLRKMLGDDVGWICREADAIALLPGWEDSKGAKAELALARALGLEVMLLDRKGEIVHWERSAA